MTASSPIPLDAFATELESLDSDAFATLVAEAYAATADEVEVDPPRIAVWEGDRRTELLAVAAADRGVPDGHAAPDDAVDAVVVASDSLDDLGSELDADLVTPADLRERLLYAVPPAEANALADRLLGVSVRSEAYDCAAASDTDAVDDGGDGETDVDGDGTAADDGTAMDAVASDATRGDTAPSPTDRPAAESADDSRAHDRPSDAAASDPSGEAAATESVTADAPSDRRSPRTVLAAVAVVALLVAAAGAGFAAGTAGIDGLGGVAGVGDDGTTDPGPTESGATGPANGSDDGSEGSLGGDDDGANTVSVADGDPTGEAERNTALAPTCERSALQVVQIQMNALRYNDNATNDGIRTLRAFASPRNKDLVGSTGEYVELFETPLYAPMLTYDTAEYSVPEIADGAASVEVVTRENGSVTGRYEFRLVRVGGGSGDTDSSLGDVDDCWMTDAVAASTE
ncbi:hypothetical protein EXE42_08990 [Halorubrum sp. SP3]|uniref:hypothetical protein n=1 Tax=unclassified Halorubrum TaxID=2642239 RepID=UPI0010F4BE7F|nr:MULTISPECIES: hypothetical protein [unclassified Halorubrum]TKX54347.1 hypothetical protein EXE42_08990 [Halorubrum sp. SP3]TKX66144.1 hypothetical protein EXE45_15470 [Halorubrum sp. SP9]